MRESTLNMDFTRLSTIPAGKLDNISPTVKSAEDQAQNSTFPLYQSDIIHKQSHTKHLNLSTNMSYDYKPMKFFDTKVITTQKDFLFFRLKLNFGARVVCYLVDQDMKRQSDDIKLWNQWYHIPVKSNYNLWVRVDEEIRPGYYETVGWGLQPLIEGTFNCKIYPGNNMSIEDASMSLKKNTTVRKDMGSIGLDIVKVKRTFDKDDKPLEDNPMFTKSIEIFEFLDDTNIRNTHDAFLTLNTVNFKKINSSSSARNILCRVHVLEKCDPQHYPLKPVECFESGYKLKNNELEVLDHFESSITYHEKNPKFSDACHIKLPRRLTPQHHLRFSFFHIQVKQKKEEASPANKRPMSVSVSTIKSPEQDRRISVNDFEDLPTCINPNRQKDEKLTEIETFLGYSCIPLFGKGLMNDGVYDLPVATEFPPSGDYLNGKDGDLKFVDGGKPVFTFEAKVYSSKTSKDATVYKFLSGIESVIELDRSAKNSEESLHKTSNKQSLNHLNQLLNEREIGQLIAEVEQCPENIIITNHDKLLKSALKLLPLYPQLNTVLFHFILKIINTVYNKFPEYLHLFISKLRNPSDYSLSLVLCDSFHKFLIEDSNLKDVLANSVVIASLIVKLVKEELSNKQHTQKRFTNSGATMDQSSYLKLVKCASDQVVNKQYNLLVVKELNSAFGELMSTGISVLPKEQWFNLFQTHIEKLLKDGSANSLSMLFDLIKAIGTHEHFFELNHPDQIFNYKDHGAKLVGVIKFGFEHHKLSFMLAAQLGDFVLHENSDVRSRAIHCIEYILQYSEQNQNSYSHLLGYLLLPFTLKLLDNFQLLNAMDIHEYRSLLTSFVYILHNTDMLLIRFLLRVEAHEKVTECFKLLLQVFSYSGQHKLMDNYMDYQNAQQQDAKAFIEQMYKNSAINRNRQSTNNSIKTKFVPKKAGMIDTKEYNNYTRKWACLTQEIGLLVLEYISIAFDAIKENRLVFLSQHLTELFSLLVQVTQSEQSKYVLEKSTSLLNHFIQSFSDHIYQKGTRYCQDLSRVGFTFGWSIFEAIKQCGSQLLFQLLLKNYEYTRNQFSMTRIQMTAALSQLEPPNNSDFIETLQAIKQINSTTTISTTFSTMTVVAIDQMIQVCNDLAKMRNTTSLNAVEDIESKGDLFLSVINGYKGTPDLRIAVLESLAQFHISRNYFQEAAVCYFHCSAIVGEFLTCTNFRINYSNAKFLSTCPSCYEETPICDASAIETDTVGQGPHFSERGLVKFLTEATHCMQKAQFYEIIHEGYKQLIPLYEQSKNYSSLAQLYRNMADCYDSLTKVELTHARVFDIFYRVGFFGKGFGNLHLQQFIYKERLVTQLAEICERMKATYSHLGKIELIQDSRTVDVSTLKEDVLYIQITHVKPYREGSQFDKNFKINNFMFSTPFTKNGKAHGGVDQQYLRKYLVTTEKSFPYLVKRIKISHIEDFELTPIEVCIDNLKDRLVDMRLVLTRQPPDIKELQRVLSGSVRVQVNSGPLEIAKVFFGQRSTMPSNKIVELEAIFRDFLKLSEEALILNKKLIKNDQIEFQEDLEEGFAELKIKLLAIIENK